MMVYCHECGIKFQKDKSRIIRTDHNFCSNACFQKSKEHLNWHKREDEFEENWWKETGEIFARNLSMKNKISEG